MKTNAIKVDYDRLNWWLAMPTEQLFSALTGSPARHGYHFVDNGSDLLAVAHLDTVCRPTGITSLTDTHLKATGLDDRIGAYTVMELLPQLGVQADIILTDDEESGQSTIKKFAPPREYKWAYEFDRGGDDVVTYGKETPAFMAQLTRHFKTIGNGSFSDVAVLSSKCCTLNVGTGVRFSHGENSDCVLAEYIALLTAFLAFHKENKNVAFPCTEPKRSFFQTGGYNIRASSMGAGYTNASPRGGFGVTSGVDDSWWDRRRNAKSGKGKWKKGKTGAAVACPLPANVCWYCGQARLTTASAYVDSGLCPYCGAEGPYDPENSVPSGYFED